MKSTASTSYAGERSDLGGRVISRVTSTGKTRKAFERPSEVWDRIEYTLSKLRELPPTAKNTAARMVRLSRKEYFRAQAAAAICPDSEFSWREELECETFWACAKTYKALDSLKCGSNTMKRNAIQNRKFIGSTDPPGPGSPIRRKYAAEVIDSGCGTANGSTVMTVSPTSSSTSFEEIG